MSYILTKLGGAMSFKAWALILFGIVTVALPGRSHAANVFIPNSGVGFRETEKQIAPKLVKVGRAALDDALMDYPSTRFKNVFAHFTAGGTVAGKTYGGGWFFCGQFNAKNAMGGYAGWKAFLLLGNRLFREDSGEDAVEANMPYWNLCAGYNSLLSQYDPTHDYSAELTYQAQSGR